VQVAVIDPEWGRNDMRPTVAGGRCGKPRKLIHTCFSNSTKKATIKAGFSFGKCSKCKKAVANPLIHVCKTKSGLRKRKAAH
jgi:hypothetical protein